MLSEAARALLVAGDLADPRPDVLPGSLSPAVLSGLSDVALNEKCHRSRQPVRKCLEDRQGLPCTTCLKGLSSPWVQLWCKPSAVTAGLTAVESDFRDLASSGPGSAESRPAGGAKASAGYVQTPPRCSTTPSYYLMRLGNIRELLQPKHKWFQGCEGYLEDFGQYSDGEKHFCYPRTVFPGDHKRNPFHKSELRSKHAARSMKRLMAVKSKEGLSDLRFGTIELTFPDKIS